MKRAWLVWIAVVAVLLVYPAATPSAKSPSYSDGIGIFIVTPPSNGGGNPPVGNTGGEDEGDGDDLAGAKVRPDGSNPTAPMFGPSRSYAGAWWMYLYNYVLIRMF
jgi:hypothetical protein